MSKPSESSAVDAVKTLLQYIGVDVNNEHFVDTASRVISSYKELYGGYDQDVSGILSSKSYDHNSYQDVILLKNIEFSSMCAHHMLPIIGKASVCYAPRDKVVGISKIVKVVDVFSRRLQIQENMTTEIAQNIQSHLNPFGVAVKISATHCCMTMRGVRQNNTLMDTYHFTGIFDQDPQRRQNFINILAGS
jgi:GTP cyclohydrolase I